MSIIQHVSELCKAHNYSCAIIGDMIKIVTKIDAWYIKNEKLKGYTLLHENKFKDTDEIYHRQKLKKNGQFTLPEIFKYIKYHERKHDQILIIKEKLNELFSLK
jgi:hypothetical protein